MLTDFVNLFVLCFIAHLIGDYVFQNDKMAAEKKTITRGTVWCSFHVITYLIPFAFIFFAGLTWWQFILIGVQHFAQDRTNFTVWFMKKKGSSNFATPPMAPWSVILMDNILHLLWISVVLGLGLI